MAKGQMVINYVPGEECRVAVVYEGKLNELHAERMDNVSHVGNIYVGRVVNVEAAIQAAFVDFGLEHNGFLHVSDLHPQYFPDANDDTTERVGKKTPRRDRPPIQECLRRGQEIAVQVLKEGVGTKGPTVTSYLSIPGRFLVMMPQMDRVGVSRKVEDEETRRKMREILDQLDLPEGFGFILRTAGMDRGKMELKRDLAYLSRLWKDMEKRWKSGNKPRLLYSESDLLVRALRDILSADIDEVIVDNDSALTRAGRFLKIVAPRSSTKLLNYTGRTPIFHALGLEEQIQMIHAREVPLPSGGRLVIDETEALVAIDVNSGKSRDARDAETNAYRTNMEATEEICRQLRLRDLGGVIVNDLIDMRFSKHRREVENLWKELLKKDRARWTIAPISEFGILEMTRQRMRGSHESQHFGDCPVCRGRGLVQKPDSVAADGLRELAAILDHDRVHRVEMVVSPRIAGELLSVKRKALTRIERTSGKHVDVRVSEAIPVDRVTFYAYDDRAADIDVTKLGRHKLRDNEMVEFELPRVGANEDWSDGPAPLEPEPAEEPIVDPAMELHPIEIEPDELDADGTPIRPGSLGANDGPGGRRGGRRRRGRRGRGRDGEGAPGETAAAPQARQEPAPAAPAAQSGGRRRGRPDQPPRAGGGRPAVPAAAHEPRTPAPVDHAMNNGFAGPGSAGGPVGEGGDEQGGRKRRRRRRRRGRGGAAPLAFGADGQPLPPPPGEPQFGEPGDRGPDEFGSSDGSRPEAAADDVENELPDPADGPSSGWSGEQDGAPASPPLSADGGEGGEGPGGGRRKRRRRRRGRGGRGPGEGAPAGQAPQFGGEQSDAPQYSGSDQQAAPWNGPDESHELNPSSSGEGPTNDADGPTSDMGGRDSAQGGDGEPGGGRRRRRRRGRGGRGGGGGPAGAGTGGESHAPGAPGFGSEQANRDPQPGRGGHGGSSGHPRDRQPDQRPRGGGGGGGRGHRDPRPASPAPIPSAPIKAATPPPPKPRTLYSSRRRLGPSERPRTIGDE